MGMDIEIDKFTPCLEDAKTGELVETTYSLASKEERTGLKKKGWAFNWTSSDLNNAEVYKLKAAGDNDIQGLVAITPMQRDRAVYVNIAESAPKNRGENRNYYGVGGHLFAIAAQRSKELGFGGFFFLDAKNRELVKYYQRVLGAKWIGGVHQYRLLVDEEDAARLLDRYTLGGEQT